MKIKTRDFILFGQTFVAFILMEIVFRAFTVGYSDGTYVVPKICIVTLIYISLAAVVLFFKTIIKGKSSKIFYAVIIGFFALVFMAQTVYYEIFETYFTFYSMVNGGQVVEFMQVIMGAIWASKIPMALLLAIAIITVALGVRKKDKADKEQRSKKPILLVMVTICIVSICISIAISSIKDENPRAPYQVLYGTVEIEESVKCSGLVGAMTIDLFKLMFGFEPKVEVEGPYVEPELGDNVIEGLDFKKLSEEESNETIKVMHDYFGTQEATKKNDKTGIFEGKNLIFITAESFSDIAIDPVYTPTLYKLQTEGYTFNNFYNPIWGVSTLDGEYTSLQGLVPKPGVWSMKESKDNSLPFTLGHQFMNKGYATKAYHNHSIYYYNRDLSHPNLGYQFKGQDREYNFKNTWPESDLEMVDKTTSDFLTPDENGSIQPFHIYYLTVSGHLEYNFYGNNMAMKNEALVKDMQVPDPCKAYMACNIELDKSLELLLQRLEEAGELENTVIALAGDHYPYGLDASQISELKGKQVGETYGIYESAFIIWSKGMEPKKMDKLSSNLDILPTLSNMFGIEYDSRLLAGKDIFSNSEGFVIFKDKNWISEKGTRDSLIGVDDEYIEKMDKKVSDLFNYSALILDEDYYSYLSKYILKN